MWTFRNPVQVNNNKIMKMIMTICSVGQKRMSTFCNPARVKLERWVLSRWTYSCIVPGHPGELYIVVCTIEYTIVVSLHTTNLICYVPEKYAHTIIYLTILPNNMRKKWFDKLCTKIICRKNISLALHQKMIGSSLQRTLIACCCCILASYG